MLGYNFKTLKEAETFLEVKKKERQPKIVDCLPIEWIIVHQADNSFVVTDKHSL
jgi:hypothetical protein